MTDDHGTGLRPLVPATRQRAAPQELLIPRAECWSQVRRTAPLAPAWFSHTLAWLLSMPSMNADSLLSLADALDEASNLISVNGEYELAQQLRALADLPRDLAPRRVQRPREF